MADYDCFPLWEQTMTGKDNIDPATLPISQSLKDTLEEWAQRYDDTLVRDDPRRSGFKTPNDEAAFKTEGIALLERLRQELGPTYELVAEV